ncbi:MAG TPA: hypothetical protein VFS42_04800 [Burkholderiaceae bacterium]|nr:hypothetical protein [Burkholderiaceae bacterium]
MDIACASERATTSVGPPAANGTTIVIGRSGYSANAAVETASAEQSESRVVSNFIIVS